MTNRELAVSRCADLNLRLESDDLVYNAFGIPVAKYLGADTDQTGQLLLRFENLNLETEWENARILRRG